MTTTKKKAKRKGFPYKDALERLIQKSRLGARRTTELETTCVALSDRLTALAAQVNEVISGMQGFDMRLTGTRERLTALEQAQRPSEKPATEKRGGDTITDPQQASALASALPVGSIVVGAAGGDPYEKTGINTWKNSVTGMVWRDHNMVRATVVRVGYEPPAPAPSEESCLRDAVVDAALAWGLSRALNYNDAVDKLAAAVKALRAHRAKKGERDAIPPKS